MSGGVPRAVWLTLGTAPGSVSVQSAAERLIGDNRPCHLIWDPSTGEIAQLISVLRAGRALGAADRLEWGAHRARGRPDGVNRQGRICVQIGVLATAAEPFTDGPLAGLEAIVSWLDAWGVTRRWPCGQPAAPGAAGAHRAVRTGPDGHPGHRVLWARGGHFGASQVPGCDHWGPGSIDIDRITGARGRPGPGRDPLVPRPAGVLPVSA